MSHLLMNGAVGSSQFCIDLQADIGQCRAISFSQSTGHNTLRADTENIITSMFHRRWRKNQNSMKNSIKSHMES